MPRGGARKLSTQRQAELAERRVQVFEAVKMGYSYRQIGERLGISHTQVGRDFDATIKEIVQPPAEAVRKLHVVRAEWMWKKAAQIAETSPNDDRVLRALDRCNTALERLAKLQGVDAPTRTEVALIPLEAIEAEIAELEAKLAAGELIVDAEVVEDPDV